MKLPNAHLALVEREKIADYLLNSGHPDNAGKALFFFALGFTQESWRELASAFHSLTARGEVTKSVASPHGLNYILDGRIDTPCGKTPVVRTSWIVDRGQDAPRLVTGYPHVE
jgi:hypothetical protein